MSASAKKKLLLHRKNFMAQRVEYLQSHVADECRRTPTCFNRFPETTSLTCRDRGLGPLGSPEQNLELLCAQTSPSPEGPHICEHDGLEPHCVHDADPCAGNGPCLNGGRCKTRVRASSQVDSGVIRVHTWL